MKDIEFWIWLQRTLGFGARLDEVLSWFGTPRELYEAGKNEWISSGIIDGKYIDRLAKFSPSESYDVMRDCEANGWKIITPECSGYPPLLENIPNFPAVLYVWGDTEFMRDSLAVGIVGTRHPSRYGMDTARRIAGELTDNGTVIVSGGALGIDSLAHDTCIEHGGKTVLVMGCGLGYDYLPNNAGLRSLVAENGAVVTEYPPFSPPAARTFILRNRIISGMSRGVTVIEAGERSGSLNTASHARSQGRDVFAVPGDTASKAYCGANKLIGEGARPVFSAADILRLYRYENVFTAGSASYGYTEPFDGLAEFPLGEPEEKMVRSSRRHKNPVVSGNAVSAKENKTEINLDNLSQNAIIVYKILIAKGPLLHIDDVVSDSRLPAYAVLSAMTELELEGAVEALGAGRYQLA